MPVIVLANQKGGVGKTTTSTNVASGLAREGHTVAMVDMDPQGTASLASTGQRHEKTIYDVLLEKATLKEIMVKGSDGVMVMPANIELAGAEVELPQAIGGQLRLRSALEQLQNVDYVIIDAPPSLGILTINALAAADSVLIPIDCSYFSLQGVQMLLDTIEKVKTHFGSGLEILGVLPTKYEGTNVAKDAVKIVEEQFPGKVFETIIPKNVKLEEAHSRAKSIFDYAPNSTGAEAYKKLVEEIINRG